MRVQLNLVKNDITVIDNYLSESEFVKIYDYVRSDIPWTLSSKSNPNSLKDWQFQFMHPKMEKDGQNLPSEFLPMIMGPYHVKFASGVAIIRSRINLFIKTKSFPFSFLKRGMGYHSDDFEEWKDIDGYKKSIFTLLLYLEDSNGATQFKNYGRMVKSKRNRVLIFPSHIFHQTVMQTNTLFRTNININFIRK